LVIDLKNQGILVVGGAGFLGSALVRELLEDSARVVVYDNFLHGVLNNLLEVRPSIHIVPGDILDCWRLGTAIKEHRIDYIFNTVGDTFVPTAYDIPSRFFNVNVLGNLNVLQATKQFGIQRTLYVSSTEVYGESDQEKVSETSQLLPLNTYAVSKLAADRLCYTFHKEHSVPVICARIFNSYGPRATEPYVIPEIITQLHKGNVVTLGNLQAQRDFTYVHDTARWLIELFKSDVPFGEPVNVGSDNCYSVEWLARTIAELMGIRDLQIRTDERRLRRLDINRFRCDKTRLMKYIDAKPRYTMEDGLRLTIEWFRKYGRWSWEDYIDGVTPLR
jgi:nucleoside-diphosphate-sugar epimerase